jgi:hypothetical protein
MIVRCDQACVLLAKHRAPHRQGPAVAGPDVRELPRVGQWATAFCAFTIPAPKNDV